MPLFFGALILLTSSPTAFRSGLCHSPCSCGKRLLGVWRFGEEGDFGKGGTDGGLGDAQADFIGSDGFAAHQTAIADAGPSGKLTPLPVLPLIESEGFDALAQGEIFAEANDVERDGLAQFQNKFRSGDAVIGGPVSVAAAIYHIFGGEAGAAAASV